MWSKFLMLFFSFCCYCCCFFVGTQAAYVDDESSLRTAILGATYDAAIRPNETMAIEMIMAPISMDQLDIGNQQMVFSFIISLSWTDYRLQWTPSSYGNITALSGATETIWTPSFVVENAASGMPGLPQTGDNQIPYRLTPTGRIEWNQILHTTTSCEMQIANFPFDSQQCSITFTSWGLDANTVNVSQSQCLDLYYTQNGEWQLMSNSISYGFFYDLQGAPYQRIFFTFTLRRRWQFYAQNLLMPIVLTSLLMCMVFALPVDTGEKVGYGVTVLLSYIVFLTWITDNLPAVSVDVSVLQVYLAIVLCMAVLANILTLWILALHHRPETQPMSPAMRHFVSKLLLPLRKAFRCKKSSPGKEDPALEVEAVDNEKTIVAHVLSSRRNSIAPAEGKDRLCSARKKAGESAPALAEVTWPEVAAMMDCLLLYSFLGVITLLTMVIIAVLYARY